MLNSKKFEKFTQYLHKTLPKTIYNLTDDLDSKIKKILITQLDCMDFISKDEFNIHKKNLLEIQEKIKKMEKQLKNLESKINYELKKNN